MSPFGVYVGVTTVFGLGFCAVVLGVFDVGTLQTMGSAFWAAAALAVVAELRPLFTAGSKDENGISTSTAFVFALLLHWGLAVALLMQTIATITADLTKRKAWWRTSFNVAQYSLSLGAAYAVLAFTNRSATAATPRGLHGGRDLAAIAVAAAVYFVANDGLVGVAVALRFGERLRHVLAKDLAYQLVTTGSLLALSPLVVLAMSTSPAFVPLLLLPLLAVYKNASDSVVREHEALHDSLTGLPNRQLLLTRAREALHDAERNALPVGLLLLDLDRFKEVNDTLGHHVGDVLLQLASTRLEGVLRPGDTVARLGGDEFAILLPALREPDAVYEVANRVRSALHDSFSLQGMQLDLEASVGIALYPHDANDFEELMQRADVAMYLAKETRNGIERYDAERDRNSPARLSLLGELRRALDDQELVLHYQPKADVLTGQIVGLEALVRWQHPERGLLYPDTFVPLAEQTGLLRPLTNRVLDLALAQAAELLASGRPLRMAVNVSVRDLHDDTFIDGLKRKLDHYGVPASELDLEITEGVVMADPVRTLANLQALSDIGVGVSLDDFGSGYSSLAYLKKLPVSELKIDKAFVLRMDLDDDDATIVRSTIELAQGLGLRVVAEGVETAEIWRQLQKLGCDTAQGYYLSRPLASDDLVTWLVRHDPRAPSLHAVPDDDTGVLTG
ncbi:MAG: putative bifunctional diguanylate cyclase/phosphodiesterase [Mycobacteriales bacterium]|nr:bifunctional diguanylate cyclase/phosphodiesterase [Frankia sp.]